MRRSSSSTNPKISRQLRVFLCHSSGDKATVRKLYHRLHAFNFDVWLDEEKLFPGQDWRQEIPRAVRASDVVLVCLSQSSITKEGYVQKEIRFALDTAEEKPDGTIFIIPVKLEECVVPERLAHYHWVNLFDKSGYDKLIKSLRLREQTLGITETVANIVTAENTLNEVSVASSINDLAGVNSVDTKPVLPNKAVDETKLQSKSPSSSDSWKNWGDHPVVVTISVLAAIVAIVVFTTGRESLAALFSQVPEPVATNTASESQTAAPAFSVTESSQRTESSTATIQSNLATDIPTTSTQSTNTAINTAALLATVKPTSMPTTTNTPPGLSILSDRLNLRSGPGISYSVVGAYPKNTILEAVGRTSDSQWLKVNLPDNKSGWMSVTGLAINIDLKHVPVVEVPPLPTTMPTAITPKPSPTSSSSELDGVYVTIVASG